MCRQADGFFQGVEKTKGVKGTAVVWMTFILRKSRRERAEALARLLLTELKGDIDSLSVETYWKDPACYEVTFSVLDPRSADDWLAATARIAIPWMVWYDPKQHRLASLVFNKTDTARYGRMEYNAIEWANGEWD